MKEGGVRTVFNCEMFLHEDGDVDDIPDVQLDHVSVSPICVGDCLKYFLLSNIFDCRVTTDNVMMYELSWRRELVCHFVLLNDSLPALLSFSFSCFATFQELLSKYFLNIKCVLAKRPRGSRPVVVVIQ